MPVESSKTLNETQSQEHSNSCWVLNVSHLCSQAGTLPSIFPTRWHTQYTTLDAHKQLPVILNCTVHSSDNTESFIYMNYCYSMHTRKRYLRVVQEKAKHWIESNGNVNCYKDKQFNTDNNRNPTYRWVLITSYLTIFKTLNESHLDELGASLVSKCALLECGCTAPKIN